ncbi:MAG TPA: hypothetical protein VG055_15485 [Planctomycetaceae bacterium]|jgi:hypothetical protein|nr:hypothetical protein [Planctomycetaceae bacterium]
MGRPKSELLIVLALVAFGAIRVLVFCAAFPVNNNMDEGNHFDVAIFYSRGVVPRALGPHARELRRWTQNWSPEFLSTPEVYLQPQEIVRPTIEEQIKANVALRAIERNHEMLEPPLYYAVAGAWLALGELLRVPEGAMFYWVRFLNALVLAATVWLSYLIARDLFPGCTFLKLAPPALLAFIPQDVLYGVNDDVLSPLSFGLVCLGLVRWMGADRSVLGAAALTGLGVAATGLTKMTNLPLIAVTLVAVAYLLLRPVGRARRPLAAVLTFAICASPLAAWLIWNKLTLGNFTGSAAKLELLGFSPKPFSKWFEHPLFSPAGIKDFWFELCASYWRGEITWYRKPIANYWVDCVYACGTLILLAAATLGVWKSRDSRQRGFLLFGLTGFWASVAFLALSSVALDFGEMGTASPLFSFPGFVCGRLMCGTLIPFAIVSAYGIATLSPRRHAAAWSFGILGALCVVIVVSEVWLHVLILQSGWNLFHTGWR